MAPKKYTDCVQPDNFIDLSFTFNVGIFNILLLVLAYGFIGVVLLATVGGPTAIILTMALVAAAITFVLWWLNGRLICLGPIGPDEKNCAIIGMVFSKGASDPLTKFGDDDYTMNLLLPPGPMDLNEPTKKEKLDEIPKESYWVEPEGHLIADNSKVKDVSRGYVKEGDSFRHLKVLHCEFEGSGLHDMLYALYALMAALVVALAFVLAGMAFPLIYFIFVIFLFLSFLASRIFGGRGGPGSGNPLDVNPELVSLADCDIVVVQGEWVYDSLHEGWNEIHPVMRCEKLGPLEPDENGQYKWSNFTWNDPKTGTAFTIDTPDNITKLRMYWCEEFKKADEAEDKGSRTNPANDWGIHPSVDGCKPPIIIE
jgi:hypothetical protein